jgi:MFS family permease
VPLLIATAPNWAWVVAANVLLGINQGLAWSMTVVMKIDLVGPRRRGLALGLNEAAGYGGVALAAGLSGLLAAVYPGVWAIAQIATGHWSDTLGRKPLIVAGMLVQAAALTLLALSGGDIPTASGAAVLLGLGTALVYPTLIAAISDAVSPISRAPVVGVYRFWRDMGYALGALIAGAAADALGYGNAIAIVAGLTAASGLWVLRDMPPDGGDRYSLPERAAHHQARPTALTSMVVYRKTVLPGWPDVVAAQGLGDQH